MEVRIEDAIKMLREKNYTVEKIINILGEIGKEVNGVAQRTGVARQDIAEILGINKRDY